MTLGTAMAVALSLKASVYPLHLFGQTYRMYAAVPALLANLGVAVALTAAFRLSNLPAGIDTTDADAYTG